MEHLTTDEVLDFVSMSELNGETMKLAATVNGHIRRCEQCLRLVQSVQTLYEAFSRRHLDAGFRAFLLEKLAETNCEEKRSK